MSGKSVVVLLLQFAVLLVRARPACGQIGAGCVSLARDWAAVSVIPLTVVVGGAVDVSTRVRGTGHTPSGRLLVPAVENQALFAALASDGGAWIPFLARRMDSGRSRRVVSLVLQETVFVGGTV